LTTFKPTAEQAEIVGIFITGESLKVEAGAGCGKTASLRLCAEAAPRRQGQYLAFNRSIVEDSKQAMPGNVRVSTAHSLAFKSKGRRMRHRLDAPRMRNHEVARALQIKPLSFAGITDGTDKPKNKVLGPEYLANVVRKALVKFCQSDDAEPALWHFPYVQGVDLRDGAPSNNLRIAEALLPPLKAFWADCESVDGVLPFDHSCYLKSWERGDPYIEADFIVVDEAQDMSPVMISVIERQASHAQIVWCGDGNQELYAWTGAVNALDRVDTDRTAWLTQSFRFGQEVAEVANFVLARLGTPLRLRGCDRESIVAPLVAPDAILCRTNATAVDNMLEQQRRGRSAHLVGGGEDVISFARAAMELQQTGSTGHFDLATFESWNEVLDYVEHDEGGSDLRLMVKLIQTYGAGQIVRALERMPREEDADVVVSTAHKAKGREWPRVQLANDFRGVSEDDEIRADDLRVLYVAATRARDVLDVDRLGLLRNVVMDWLMGVGA
jgi:hypothetical protein